MNQQDFNKLVEIRKILNAAYDHYFKYSDGHCKKDDGNISIEFGNYWEDNSREMKIISINIYSYVFGNCRTHCYYSLDEALEVVKRWYKEELEHDYEKDAT